jgi:hypothetical protein
MLANIKFKTIEELKMTRAEDNCKDFYIKQEDDDMFYQQAYSQDEVAHALSMVLDESSAEPQYIKVVKDYFFNSGEAVFNNSQIAQDNKD